MIVAVASSATSILHAYHQTNSLKEKLKELRVELESANTKIASLEEKEKTCRTENAELRAEIRLLRERINKTDHADDKGNSK